MSIEHVIRVASLEDSEKFDVEDHEATTPEQRLAVVERLRQEWFGDFDPERRLERVLACSVSSGTRFLLVGGHAVAIHAEPRFTEDLDVFVEPTLRNARKLHAALVDFGFEAVAPLPAQLAKPDKVTERRTGRTAAANKDGLAIWIRDHGVGATRRWSVWVRRLQPELVSHTFRSRGHWHLSSA